MFLLIFVLLFSGCAADEDVSSSRIFGHRDATMTANDSDAALPSALGMHSHKADEEEQFVPFSSSASAERRALVSCRDCFIFIFLFVFSNILMLYRVILCRGS